MAEGLRSALPMASIFGICCLLPAAAAYPPGPTGTGIPDTPCTWTGCPQPAGTVGGNETECKVRTLAYEHALKLLPERAPLRTYFDALQLEMLCGTPPPARALHAHPDAAVEGSEEGFPPAHDSSTADGGSGLHVDATAGSDETGDGSQQQPFMTLVKALRTARATKAAASSSKHTAPPAIILHAGVHFLNDTLVLGAEDSGQVIRNLPGAEAWISGGVPVIAPQWKLHKKSIYVAQLPSEITAVPALYTVTPHQRLVRARYPNGNWEIDQWGWCSTVPCLSMTCRGNVDTDPGLSCPRYGGPNSLTGANAIPGGHSDSVVQWWPVLKKDKPKQLTGPPGNCSSPGNCTHYSYTMGQGGPCALWGSCDSDPANVGASYWCGDLVAGGGAGFDHEMSQGFLSLPMGVTYNTTKPELAHFANWTDARGAIVHAWQNGGGWFTNMFEVTSHDPVSGNISFENQEQPGFPKGGWQGARNWQGGVNGPDGAPWIVDGVFEELDSPGEMTTATHWQDKIFIAAIS
jgi:hypothetical protein